MHNPILPMPHPEEPARPGAATPPKPGEEKASTPAPHPTSLETPPTSEALTLAVPDREAAASEPVVASGARPAVPTLGKESTGPALAPPPHPTSSIAAPPKPGPTLASPSPEHVLLDSGPAAPAQPAHPATAERTASAPTPAESTRGTLIGDAGPPTPPVHPGFGSTATRTELNEGQAGGPGTVGHSGPVSAPNVPEYTDENHPGGWIKIDGHWQPAVLDGGPWYPTLPGAQTSGGVQINSQPTTPGTTPGGQIPGNGPGGGDPPAGPGPYGPVSAPNLPEYTDANHPHGWVKVDGRWQPAVLDGAPWYPTLPGSEER